MDCDMPEFNYNVKWIILIGAIDFMNISNKDLNLLRVFKTLMQERNVSKAAEHLYLSQPALSNALARLRLDLNDDLFVRAGRGMVPTPKALELNSKIEKLLQQAEELYGMQSFKPQNLNHRFTIAATDYLEHILLPMLLPFLEENAPETQLVFRPTLGVLPKIDLEKGTCDLAIAGFLGEPPESYFKQWVHTDTYSCLIRKNHPKLKKNNLTLKSFLELEHILVSPQGDLLGAMDMALAEKKMRRKVRAGISSFSMAPAIIAKSDSIVTLPTLLAEHYSKIFRLQLMSPPVKLEPINIFQIWHQRTQSSQAHRWLRDTIFNILGNIRLTASF